MTQSKGFTHMAITKTKALTPEASAIEANEAARAALILAAEKVQTLSIAVDEADLGMDEITDGWDAGDETASAADFSLAQVEFKRATALYEAAQRSAQVIEKSIVNVSTELAEIVKPWVEAALPGVSVSATFIMPTGKPSLLPVAYVVQSSPTKAKGGGVVEGSVAVTYIRSPLHREIDGNAVEHAASLAGCKIGAGGSSRTEDGQTTDTLRVNVEYGHAPIPLITEPPTDATASRLAGGLASDLAGSTTTGRLQMQQGGALSSDVVTVKPNGGTVVKSETDATGSRRTEVEVKLTYWKHGTRQMSATMDTKLRSVVKGRVDTFTQGLGKCTSAEVASIVSPDYSGLTNVAVLLTFASRIR
jgi:hypothetical protein